MSLTPRHKHYPSIESSSDTSPLFGLQNDINMLFNDYISGSWPNHFDDAKQVFVPAIDLTRSDKSYQLRAELPGLKDDEVEVFIDDGYLVIRGEHNVEEMSESKTYVVHETNQGSFYRSIPLPKDAIAEKTSKASLKGGVLTVEIPRLEQAKLKIQDILVKSD